MSSATLATTKQLIMTRTAELSIYAHLKRLVVTKAINIVMGQIVTFCITFTVVLHNYSINSS